MSTQQDDHNPQQPGVIQSYDVAKLKLLEAAAAKRATLLQPIDDGSGIDIYQTHESQVDTVDKTGKKLPLLATPSYTILTSVEDRNEACRFYEAEYARTHNIFNLKEIAKIADEVSMLSNRYMFTTEFRWKVNPYSESVILIPDNHMLEMSNPSDMTIEQMQTIEEIMPVPNLMKRPTADPDEIRRSINKQIHEETMQLKLGKLAPCLSYATGGDPFTSVTDEWGKNQILKCPACDSFACTHIRMAYETGYDVKIWGLLSNTDRVQLVLAVPVFGEVFHRVRVSFSVAEDWEGKERIMLNVDPRSHLVTDRFFDFEGPWDNFNFTPAEQDKNFMRKVIDDLQLSVDRRSPMWLKLSKMAQGFPAEQVCGHARHSYASSKFLLGYLTGRENPHGVEGHEIERRTDCCAFTIEHYGLCYHCYRSIDTGAFNVVNVNL